MLVYAKSQVVAHVSDSPETHPEDSVPRSGGIRALFEPLSPGDDHYDRPRDRPAMRLLPFAGVAAAIELFDLLLTSRLQGAVQGGSTLAQAGSIVSLLANISFVLLMALALAMFLFANRRTPRIAMPLMVGYLSFAGLNLLINLTTLIAAPHLTNQSQLGLTLDLGLAFISITLNFSLWYQLADAHLPGGAFDFEPNGHRPDEPPRWFDYFVLSFFTNSTFGPTLENTRTRPAKALMMVQTSIALVILVLLVARIIQAD